MATPVRRHGFRSMGTSVELLGAADADDRVFARAAAQVERVFADEDLRCSRFRDDSELTRVNRSAGHPTRVSVGLAAIVAGALEAAARTDGRFDPTVLDAVVGAGYDRDFDDVLAGARAALRPPRPCGRWREIELDGDVLNLPVGVGLDLGGIAKGWAVDLAATEALDAGLDWALVNAGGDLRSIGAVPAEGIDVAVEDPQAPGADVLRVQLLGGALATSSITRRAWGVGLHHLIDPSTGAPAATGVLQATVWAPTCAEAEVLAKDTVLRGTGTFDGTPGVLVTADGRVLTNLPAETQVAA